MAFNINGITINSSDNLAGLEGVTTWVTGIKNGTPSPFYSKVSWDDAVNLFPELENSGIRPNFDGLKLGAFDDPRKAAYFSAYFLQNPPGRDVIDSLIRRRPSSLKQHWNPGFPSELNDIPFDYSRLKELVDGIPDSKIDKLQRDDEKSKVDLDTWLTKLPDLQNRNSAEDVVNNLLQTKPEWINALRAVSTKNRNDAKDEAIDAIKNGKSEEEALDEIKAFHGLTESFLARLIKLSGIK